MKILMVSIPTLHFFRWANQLQDAGHEVYWFDITGMSQPVSKISWIQQKVDWKLKWNYPGRILVKNKFPKLYEFIQQFNQKDTAKTFENYLNEIQPDVVHSFSLQLSCIPIIGIMKKYKNVKWIYSSWGSDVYYYKSIGVKEADFVEVIKRMNYYISDCLRDENILRQKGYLNEFLGVFPGNGGVDINEDFITTPEKRKIILVKGYNDFIGRGKYILKAIEKIDISYFEGLEILIYGGDDEIKEIINNSKNFKNLNFKFYKRDEYIDNVALIEIMGKSIMHIGNSKSDGIPNAMIEAMAMGAFPIQSDPGGATSEIIKDGYNGLLIQNCECEIEISEKIILALKNNKMIQDAFSINTKMISEFQSSKKLKNKIVNIYEKINQGVNC